jgi:YD repeat-containing protein
MVGQSGTVMILFTDLANSTELLQRAGDEDAQRIFKAHYQLLRDGTSTDSVFDQANRLLEDTKIRYRYDANGNLIEKTDKVTAGATLYTYDAENQLIGVRLPGAAGTTTYRYDGLGRRSRSASTAVARGTSTTTRTSCWSTTAPTS